MTKLGSRKLHIRPQVTKTGSIIGDRIDYKGVGALRAKRHIPIYPAKINPSNPLPPPPPAPWVTEKRTLREVGLSTVCFIYKLKKRAFHTGLRGIINPEKPQTKVTNINKPVLSEEDMTLTVVTRTYTLKSNFLPTNHKYTDKWINCKVVSRQPSRIECELRNVGYKRDGKN